MADKRTADRCPRMAAGASVGRLAFFALSPRFSGARLLAAVLPSIYADVGLWSSTVGKRLEELAATASHVDLMTFSPRTCSLGPDCRKGDP